MVGGRRQGAAGAAATASDGGPGGFLEDVEQIKGRKLTPGEAERYIFPRIADLGDESDVSLTAEEARIVAEKEKDTSRKLTAQEIFLALDRARALGQI